MEHSAFVEKSLFPFAIMLWKGDRNFTHLQRPADDLSGRMMFFKQQDIHFTFYTSFYTPLYLNASALLNGGRSHKSKSYIVFRTLSETSYSTSSFSNL